MTDTTLHLHRLPTKGNPAGQDVLVPYADIVYINTRKMIKARWIAITHVDGHVDSLWLAHGATIDRDRTEPVDELLKLKVTAKSGDGAGK